MPFELLMESTAVNIFIAMDSISRSVDILPVKIVGAQKKRRGIKSEIKCLHLVSISLEVLSGFNPFLWC